MLFTILSLLIISNISTQQGLKELQGTSVKLVEGRRVNEGIVQVYTRDKGWVTVCHGNAHLVTSVCTWLGYTRANETDKKQRVISNYNTVYDVSCPDTVQQISDCSISPCTRQTGYLTVQCTGHPDCLVTTEDSSAVIPGNSTLLLGDKMCYCGRGGVVSCRCRNVPHLCTDGTIPQFDAECKPQCALCADQQRADLCQFYRTNNRCREPRVQQICRKSCGTCNRSAAGSTCTDEYDTYICRKWKDMGSCTQDKIRAKCKRTCKVCRPVPESTCVNEYKTQSCKIWKRAGHCKNSGSVRGWCKKTCDLCDTTPSCKDKRDKTSCEWSKARGSCGYNMKVLENCPATCGLCEPITPQNCRDIYKSDTCKVWRLNGACEHNKVVQRYCPMSCGVCDTVGKEDQCRDTSPGKICDYYKRTGYCNQLDYKDMMLKTCARTCELCDVTSTCADKIATRTCVTWRDGGFCDINSSVREELCPLTCETC